MTTYNFLLIDDDETYCEGLKTSAHQIGIDEFNLNILVTSFHNWEDGADYLNDNFIHALILDAKCMIDREQQTEDFGFLPTVIANLVDFEKKQNRHIPFAVNTGYFGEKETEVMQRVVHERQSKIFDKTLPKNDLIAFLVEEIKRAPTTKIERDYHDVFEVFDRNYLDSTFKTHLLQIIRKSDSDNPTEIKNTLALVRSLQEGVFQEVSKIDKTIIPDIFVKPNVSFWKVQNHLSGNKSKYSAYKPSTEVFQNTRIEYLSECIYKIASDNGSHNPYDKTELPSRYTVKSLVFAFLEQLLWFKAIMEKALKK